MSISVKNISKIYGEQTALDQISFEVKKGEIIGFLGPNGAGKSTTMKILTGYIPSSSGEAEVCSLKVGSDDLNIKSKIGYLPEHNPLYLDMYVKEYLSYVARIYKIKNIEERVHEMIELTGLTREQHKKIGQLSKGYRQRVGLAQALIHDPEVLILDEPTTGLDPNQLEEIRELIKKVGKSKTVMLSTHIMQEVEAICDRVIIIDKGCIVANENIKEATERSGRVILQFDKPIDRAKFKLDLTLDVKLLDSCLYEVLTDKEIERSQEKEIIKWSLENDLIIRQIRQETNRLEDYFKELTKN
ncbi:gliding motility-associated ABC transporter ATP-binding subunit GldA [Flavobacteriales bacterium]|nr:gliding motility-associated ABC transporter ATP-binding subunit GldA [Flavobacteriales bacterium]